MKRCLLGVLLVSAACNDGGLQITGDGGGALPDMTMAAVGVRAGQPCKASTECPQATDPQYKATCLMPPTFPGGYCIQPCAHGFGCPDPGMSCRPLSATASANGCFKDCTSDLDCRVAEGYKCCKQWGALGGPASVCYPSKCPN